MAADDVDRFMQSQGIYRPQGRTAAASAGGGVSDFLGSQGMMVQNPSTFPGPFQSMADFMSWYSALPQAHQQAIQQATSASTAPAVPANGGVPLAVFSSPGVIAGSAPGSAPQSGPSAGQLFDSAGNPIDVQQRLGIPPGGAPSGPASSDIFDSAGNVIVPSDLSNVTQGPSGAPASSQGNLTGQANPNPAGIPLGTLPQGIGLGGALPPVTPGPLPPGSENAGVSLPPYRFVTSGVGFGM